MIIKDFLSQPIPLLICSGLLEYPVPLDFFSSLKFRFWKNQNSISVLTWVLVYINWGNQGPIFKGKSMLSVHKEFCKPLVCPCQYIWVYSSNLACLFHINWAQSWQNMRLWQKMVLNFGTILKIQNENSSISALKFLSNLAWKSWINHFKIQVCKKIPTFIYKYHSVLFQLALYATSFND